MFGKQDMGFGETFYVAFAELVYQLSIHGFFLCLGIDSYTISSHRIFYPADLL
jgi:hypothetical protein